MKHLILIAILALSACAHEPPCTDKYSPEACAKADQAMLQYQLMQYSSEPGWIAPLQNLSNEVNRPQPVKPQATHCVTKYDRDISGNLMSYTECR